LKNSGLGRRQRRREGGKASEEFLSRKFQGEELKNI
jgi:hypothetical protein